MLKRDSNAMYYGLSVGYSTESHVLIVLVIEWEITMGLIHDERSWFYYWYIILGDCATLTGKWINSFRLTLLAAGNHKI